MIRNKILIWTFLFAFAINSNSQSNNPDEIALEIINNAAFCSLVTVDTEGYPVSRMMQTLPVADDFVIWLGTKISTQKVKQIKDHHKVSVYYTEQNSTGYVNVQGTAEIITDAESKEKYWKDGWENYYPNKEKDYVLIRITPLKVQLVSYTQGIISTSEDWKATELTFE